MRLRNGHPVATSEVVQVYLHDPVAESVPMVQRLIAAPRVDLAPGQARTVEIALPADLTSFTGRAGRRIVEPGAVQLWVGASSSDIRGVLELTVTGARREVGADRALVGAVAVREG